MSRRGARAITFSSNSALLPILVFSSPKAPELPNREANPAVAEETDDFPKISITSEGGLVSAEGSGDVEAEKEKGDDCEGEGAAAEREEQEEVEKGVVVDPNCANRDCEVVWPNKEVPVVELPKEEVDFPEMEGNAASEELSKGTPIANLKFEGGENIGAEGRGGVRGGGGGEEIGWVLESLSSFVLLFSWVGFISALLSFFSSNGLVSGTTPTGASALGPRVNSSSSDSSSTFAILGFAPKKSACTRSFASLHASLILIVSFRKFRFSFFRAFFAFRFRPS